jgi:hypothetical protein
MHVVFSVSEPRPMSTVRMQTAEASPGNGHHSMFLRHALSGYLIGSHVRTTAFWPMRAGILKIGLDELHIYFSESYNAIVRESIGD